MSHTRGASTISSPTRTNGRARTAKTSHYSTGSFSMSAPSIKNDLIEHSMKNDDNMIKLNELLTRTLLQARNNLDDLSDLTTKKLGPKAALYHHFLDDASDPLTYESRDLRDDGLKAQRKNDMQENSKIRQNQRKIAPLDLGDVSLPNETLMNQLKTDLALKELERKQKGLFGSYLKDIFTRTRNLIDNLWEEMHVAQKERDRFSKQYFYPETIMNYIQIFMEISRLCKIRSIQHKVLANVEQREVYISRLKEIGRKITTSNVKNPQSLLDDPVVTNEVPTIISSLRSVSVALVEAVVIWRNELPKKTAFVWKGQNYLLKMQSDLDFLKLSDLAQLFDFPLDNNPMLLPTSLRSNGQENSETDTRHSYADTTFKNLRVTSMAEDKMQASMFDKQLKSVALYAPKDGKESSLPRLVTSNIETRRSATTDGVRHHKKINKLQSFLTPTLTSLTAQMLERVKQADEIIYKEDMFLRYLEQRKRKDKAAIKIQCQFRKYAARQYAKRLREEMMPTVRAKREKRKWATMQRNKVKEEILKEQFMKRKSEGKVEIPEHEDMFPAKLPPVSGRFSNNVFAMAGLDINADQPQHHLA